MPVSDGTDGQEVWVAKSGIGTFSPSALRRRREQKGFTLTELASLSGVSQASLSSWEAGKVIPTPSNLAAVAHAVDAHVADLAPVRAEHTRMTDLRHQAGLSQAAVALAIGMSQASVANIESGATRPRPAATAALAGAYGVNEPTVTRVWEATRTARMTRLKAR